MGCSVGFVNFTAGANLMGSDLYNKLTKYLVQHLKTVREVRLLCTLTKSRD